MVDIIRKKKRWTTKRLLTIAGIAAIVLLVVGSYYFTSGKSRLNVDTERISISTVSKGAFQETIPVNGDVMPFTSIYLDALEGGRVEEKYVDDGTIMKKGQPILRLSNTNLELQLVSQQTGVYNNITQMQIARNAAGVIAVELMAAAEGIEYHAPLKTSPKLQAIHDAVRAHSPHFTADRYWADEMSALQGAVLAGEIAAEGVAFGRDASYQN